MYTLITGGLGYIGSHVAVCALLENKNIIILDNTPNPRVLDSIRTLGKSRDEQLIYIQKDIRDKSCATLFESYSIECVMHFAALKSVRESQEKPELYYDVNVRGTFCLLETMRAYNCKRFIYSSSATVYGSEPAPVYEDSPTGIGLQCNYAQNKYDVEQHLINNYKDWNITILRYFNPIGAHPSGLLGDNPSGIPNNIFPYLMRVANQEYKVFTLFGNDYDTLDGTCIRDYIHIEDLARAHMAVYFRAKQTGVSVYNVGTGRGTSVWELINALNEVLTRAGRPHLPVTTGPRRVGDVAVSYANVDKIDKELDFKTQYTIEEMCQHGLQFQSKHLEQ